MGFERFNKLVLAALLATLALCAAINYAVNPYGLFGDVAGRAYAVRGTERTEKYLFSFNYIPANFDGLLIGSSISDNWDTSALSLGRVYNASLKGGNISEEAIIAGNVLRRRPPRTILFVIYPFITASTGRQSGHMIPQEYWAALGSVQLLDTYLAGWAIERRLVAQTATPSGQDRFVAPPAPKPAPGRVRQVIERFPVDERAVAEYGALLALARQAGARIFGVIPLVPRSSDPYQAKAFAGYNSRMKRLFLPSEPVIDLNECPELSAIALDDRSFQDGSHYTTEAAARLMAVLDQKLAAAK